MESLSTAAKRRIHFSGRPGSKGRQLYPEKLSYSRELSPLVAMFPKLHTLDSSIFLLIFVAHFLGCAFTYMLTYESDVNWMVSDHLPTSLASGESEDCPARRTAGVCWNCADCSWCKNSADLSIGCMFIP